MRFVFGVTMLLTIVGWTPASELPTPTEQALQTVRECMNKFPGPWPENWQNEYIDTIRRAIVRSEEPPDFAKHLNILRNGFPSYWKDLKKSRDRAVFEVHCAQIRWYTERLMSTRLSGEGVKLNLPRSWHDFLNYTRLFMQFSSLRSPIVLRGLQRNHHWENIHNIETPLFKDNTDWTEAITPIPKKGSAREVMPMR